jgi:hypothetical protein
MQCFTGFVNEYLFFFLFTSIITNIFLCVSQIANILNRVVGAIGRKPLKVLVQVNTSGEECG